MLKKDHPYMRSNTGEIQANMYDYQVFKIHN